MTHFLITTSDERSWRTGVPVLFLGEWCLRYDRRHVWGAIVDRTVARPFGLGSDERVRNVAYVQGLVARLLPEVSEALNELHGCRRSSRYWNIVLGHWLQRYCAMVFNRYFTIEQALREYSVETSSWINAGSHPLASQDSLAFIWSCNDAQWNQEIFGRILEFMGFSGLERQAFDANPAAQDTSPRTVTNPRRSAKGWLRAVAVWLGSAVRRESDAVLIKTYLPKSKELALQALLLQIPQLWSSPNAADARVDLSLRRSLRLPVEGHAGFERLVREILFDVMPRCFVEAYKAIGNQVADLAWPSRPKFIFTSNSFDTDEIFKRWTAEKVEAGTRYIAGQHGNNYGAHIYYGNRHWPERSATDRFVSWGWRDDRNAVPAFLFKTIGPRIARTQTPSRLLLLELHYPQMVSVEDQTDEFASYQAQQFRFAEQLPAEIRHQTTVRIHGNSANHFWFDKERWVEREIDVEIEDGRLPLVNLIADSRIVVHSYNSTGIIETLARDIPTVCFWENGLDHLLPEAKPFYEALQRAGILQPSAEAAAAHIACVWNDVEGWWRAPTTRDASRAFCEQFGRSVDRPLTTLKRILLADPATTHELNGS